MGMDVLRCKTSDMILKEITMHMIAYNGIRQLMVEAASRNGVSQRRISFKGSLQAIRQWEPLLKYAKLRRLNWQQLLDHLYQLIGGLVVLERPGRREPGALNPDYVLEIYSATAPALPYLLLHAVVRMKVALKTMTFSNYFAHHRVTMASPNNPSKALVFLLATIPNA